MSIPIQTNIKKLFPQEVCEYYLDVQSLKKMSAIKLILINHNINTIGQCVPPELYEYYLNIKNVRRRCKYCKKDVFCTDTFYCSYKCFEAYGDWVFNKMFPK